MAREGEPQECRSFVLTRSSGCGHSHHLSVSGSDVPNPHYGYLAWSVHVSSTLLVIFRRPDLLLPKQLRTTKDFSLRLIRQ